PHSFPTRRSSDLLFLPKRLARPPTVDLKNRASSREAIVAQASCLWGRRASRLLNQSPLPTHRQLAAQTRLYAASPFQGCELCNHGIGATCSNRGRFDPSSRTANAGQFSQASR